MGTLSRVTAGMILITATIVGGSMAALAVLKNTGDKKSYEIVKKVQKKLGIRQDGKFGGGTEAAVKSYQRRKDMPTVDGIVGEDTWQTMFGEHKGPYLKKGSRGKGVTELQKKLNRAKGTGLVDVDGKFGTSTEVALQKYQKARGIEPNGDLKSNSRYMMKWGK